MVNDKNVKRASRCQRKWKAGAGEGDNLRVVEPLEQQGIPARALARGDIKAGSVIAIFIFFSISSAWETTSSSA
jgi:hypothetical protein